LFGWDTLPLLPVDRERQRRQKQMRRKATARQAKGCRQLRQLQFRGVRVTYVRNVDAPALPKQPPEACRSVEVPLTLEDQSGVAIGNTTAFEGLGVLTGAQRQFGTGIRHLIETGQPAGVRGVQS
jgi:hypothetical protein